ncbi:MAG: VWA domain-containing protein [Planctomycetia bacterium]|nr:VWA domain-containing protein [Planctomycetia bacterium]
MFKQMIGMVLFMLPLGMWGTVQSAESVTSVVDAAAPPTIVASAEIPKTAMMQVTPGEENDYFVLSVTPGIVETYPQVDVVVLCDTSATMAGGFREEQLAALSLLLGSLGSEDRVQILACDVKTIPLTTGWSSPTADSVTVAVEKLQNRIPLGSSDLKKALETAAGAFAGSTGGKVIVYLGQGTSRANILLPSEFSDLANSLASQEISVDAVAMGPNIDIVLLKTLAAKTGGNVIYPSETGVDTFLLNDVAVLPEVIRTKVLWPAAEAQQIMDSSIQSLYPAPILPLRYDRETILIGKVKKGTSRVKLTIALKDGRKLDYTISPTSVTAPYIQEMVQYVEEKKGWLPLVNQSDVTNVVQNVNNHVETLLALAQQYLDQDNMALDEAAKLVEQARLKDPNHAKVQEMSRVIAGLQDSMQNKMGDFGVPANAGLDLSTTVARDDALAQASRVRVQNTVNDARQLMASQPEEAIAILEIELDTINGEELPPEVKDSLIKQIRGTTREAKARQEELAIRDQENRTRLAEMRERQIALDNAKTDRQKIQQMMRRFDSLMQEGKYRQAEEEVAVKILERDSFNTAAVAGTLTARYKGYVDQIVATNIRRHKGFVDALQQVEVAHIPFPDDPPISYPDSEVWVRLSQNRVEKYGAMDLAQRSKVEDKINNVLKEPLEEPINASETELQTVIDQLKKDHGIEIQIDNVALEELGLSADMPITLNVGGISLGAALRLMLSSHDLMYVIEDEVLKITSKEAADMNLTTRVYPVADLVLPIENISPMGGGLIGGGSMGSSGGGMGGGMGGGFMSQPSPKPVRVSEDVSEETSQSFFNLPESKKIVPAQSSAKKSVSVSEKWQSYFRGLKDATPEQLQASQAEIRQTVRDLRSRQKFGEIITLIEAALLTNEAQPWMYETLAISMVMDKRPADDVERALTSALEFCEDPNQMLLIGTYLENLGFPQRALAIYEQLGKLFPNDVQPFVFALKLARRPDVDDVSAIQWASLGLLRLEVDAERQKDWQEALWSAKAVVTRLKKEGKTAEAESFAAAMEKAQQRDCKIVVSWTGNADIDLFVEEPNGSICSLRNQRSAGGGVLTGDGYTRQNGRDGSSRASETYICSQGFSGTYKLLAKRVWGEVTGNKVLVDITIHYGSGEEKRIKKALPLENDALGVEFALENGRRKESLQEQQLVRMVKNAKNVQLAQQLFDNVDHKAMASLSGSTNTGSGYFPYFSGGAVGYEPQIIWLPEGTQMSATGVISADRRYVRISAAPLFSAVTDVYVFNYVTGDEEQTRSGSSSGIGSSGNSMF